MECLESFVSKIFPTSYDLREKETLLRERKDKAKHQGIDHLKNIFDLTPENEIAYLDSPEQRADSSNNSSSDYYLKKVHDALTRLFYSLGKQVASQPFYFIIIPLIVSIIGISGLLELRNNNFDSRSEYFFTSELDTKLQETSIVESIFQNPPYMGFLSSRPTRLNSSIRVIASASENGDLIGGVASLQEMIESTGFLWENEMYSYKDVCATKNEECYSTITVKRTEEETAVDEKEWFTYESSSFSISQLEEKNGNKTTGGMALIDYWLRGDDADLERTLTFEYRFLESIKNASITGVNFVYLASTSLDEEIENNTKSILSSTVLSFVIVCVFALLSAIESDWVKSKPIASLLGIITICLAIGTAFGFLIYSDVPFPAMNIVAAFLMLGIGIDGMFMILSAWQRTRLQDDVSTRLAETYSEVAAPIVIVAIVHVAALCAGLFAPFHSVKVFCLYGVVSTVFMCVWTLTLFGSLLALSGYREESQRHCITHLRVKSESEAENLGCCYNFWCAGGINREDPWNVKDNQSRSTEIFFRDSFGTALDFPATKVFIGILLIAYVGGALYGCTNSRSGMELEHLVRDDSYAQDFLEKLCSLSGYPHIIQIAVIDDILYSDPEIQSALVKMHLNLEKILHITPDPSLSWIRQFDRYLSTNPAIQATVSDNEEAFISELKNRFLLQHNNSAFSWDVVFNENGTRIVASRFPIVAEILPTPEENIELLNQVTFVAKEAPFQVFVISPAISFFYQYRVKTSVIHQILALTILLTLLATLLFVPNVSGFVLISLSLFLFEVGLIGYVSLWQVYMDSIFLISLIICTSYGITFTIFFFYGYMSTKASNQQERVYQTLGKCGYPIIQGAISTCLAIIPFLLIPSYLFFTFFKIFLIASILEIFLSLVFIPLSMMVFYHDLYIEESPVLLRAQRKDDESEFERPTETTSLESSIITTEENLDDLISSVDESTEEERKNLKDH